MDLILAQRQVFPFKAQLMLTNLNPDLFFINILLKIFNSKLWMKRSIESVHFIIS